MLTALALGHFGFSILMYEETFLGIFEELEKLFFRSSFRKLILERSMEEVDIGLRYERSLLTLYQEAGGRRSFVVLTVCLLITRTRTSRHQNAQLGNFKLIMSRRRIVCILYD